MTESSQLEGRYQRVLPKVTKMGSIISHTIDYNGVVVLKGQRHPKLTHAKYKRKIDKSSLK